MANQSQAIPNNPTNKVEPQKPVYTLSADGAVNPAGGYNKVTKAGVAALTLAAPAASGLELTVYSTTAQAHTLTVTNGIGGVGAGADVGTFGGAIGDTVTLFSDGSYWYVKNSTNVTFA